MYKTIRFLLVLWSTSKTTTHKRDNVVGERGSEEAASVSVLSVIDHQGHYAGKHLGQHFHCNVL